MKYSLFHNKRTFKIRDKIYSFESPLIMGIVNLSADSFYSGSVIKNIKEFEKTIEKQISEGAHIIDIGAVSSRPGADLIDSQSEIKILKPFLNVIKNFNGFIFSIDTYNSETAKFCVLEYGFSIINDISAFSIDNEMLNTILELNVPYILMHMKGIPKTMQNNPKYSNVVSEVYNFLAEKIKILTSHNFSDIIIDPGFGFGKTIDDNYILLKNLSVFKTLNFPILVGISRKSMLYKLLNITPNEALPATMAAHTIALLNGADILRVHDVKETKQLVEIYKKYKSVIL
ncbi:MAG: dihydropteroate synthase [Bacteroidales bacterium]|nr:dihydropteroate synthase [Bacteroidales bacterium]